MRGTIISLLCMVVVLVTIVAFGHWGLSEDKHPLAATRFMDNGDGTVTDLTTCLVWLQKADWGGAKPWEDCTTSHDDAHSRAGILISGTVGANLSDGSVEGDWRLPTKTELVGGGVFIDAGIHYVHMMMEIGGFPERVYAAVVPKAYLQAESDDGVTLVAHLPGGVIGLVNVFSAPGRRDLRNWVSISGTKDRLKARSNASTLSWRRN